MGSETTNESLGLSVADYDGDGDQDVFITHRETPQLFRLENAQFTNVVSDPTVFSPRSMDLLKNSFSVSWVDFDHDGDLDLYLGRALFDLSPDKLVSSPKSVGPLHDCLFKNQGADGPFIEIGTRVQLVDFQATSATLSNAWADMDGDGLWEVAIGGSGKQGKDTRLFEERADGTFAEKTAAFPNLVDPASVNSLQWMDFDRDNDLDLLMVRNEGPSFVILNDQGQLADSITLPAETTWGTASGSAFDYNLDGFPDVAIANRRDDQEPRLWQNMLEYPSFAENPVINVADKVGLSDGAGLVQGILANDFNGDGDLDLFLGRQSSSGRVFKNVNRSGSDAPMNKWIGIHLTPSGNGTAIGAKVSLAQSSGQPLGTQLVDPGSGRGTQQPSRLIFGLGDLDESVSVTVQWPSGRQSTFTVAPNALNTVIPVNEPTSFSIFDDSVEKTIEFMPDTGLMNWVFSWETDYWTDPTLDVVEIELARGSDCTINDVTLQDGVTYGVTTQITHQRDLATGAITYRHELRWANRPCVPGCSYRFSVESGLGNSNDFIPTTQTGLLVFKVCPVSL